MSARNVRVAHLRVGDRLMVERRPVAQVAGQPSTWLLPTSRKVAGRRTPEGGVVYAATIVAIASQMVTGNRRRALRTYTVVTDLGEISCPLVGGNAVTMAGAK